MKVFLVGMPGSGKSTLGKQIARLMDMPFIDLDTEIERLVRTSISELFQQHGEDYFREVERDTLDKIIHEQDSFVMATGGGTPCFHENMSAMNKAGLSVYIDLPSQEIINRMSKKGMVQRPLFHGLDAADMVKAFDQKFNHRIPFYKKAKIEIAGDYITAERIIHLISLQSKAKN
ncbi:shikimate kinase [Porifericola rhodea]|uniref:shikimate kinase n=1 Tax=Porifericola rhodea TaxID=930972 RepID=UPI002666F85A|nr:shikimate kinase [Porifericola rhodea]WKN32372.1 shikimate kinase [Porifericola rhodea]